MLRLRSAAIMVAAGAAILMTVSTAAAQASVAPRPVAPAGFKGTSINAAAMRGATVRIIKLDPRTCAEYNRSHPGTVPGCRAKVYTYSRNHQALPAGTKAASSYWYWSGSREECSIYGCWYWSVNLTMDGVANGSHVYQWNVGCTAGGYDTSCTWWGYLYNGGGWPNYAMQFGENSQSCVGPYNIGCVAHGQRQWVDDYGNFTTYYNW
jgi:hypothetical protein